jgi:isopentenyl diphosphate isomerase/L-lactate dehydrogenase-like FMN-dependent dehydrogenase
VVVQRVQENEVAEAVRDQTVVAVAGGAALDSAFTGSRRDAGIFSLVALFSAKSLWTVGFSGGIRSGLD